MISSKVRLNCGNCLFACGSNFKGSEQNIFTVKSDDVVEYTLQIPVPTTLDEHPCLQLDCSCRICRRCKFQAWWRSAENLSGSRKKYFPLALCLCYEAKDIYLHVGPPTARYLTVEYRTRVKRQLQGLRGTFTKISWYFVGKTRAGDTLLLDRNYLRRRTRCFFSVFEYELEDKWPPVADHLKTRVSSRKPILWSSTSKSRA